MRRPDSGIRGIVVQATNEGWIRCREFAAAAAIATTLALLLTGQFNRAVIVSLVRDTAEKNKLDPDDFLRMAEIESGLDPHARHPVSGASGLFQFLPSTARQYKLKSVFDAQANANAAAALWSDNSRALKKGSDENRRRRSFISRISKGLGARSSCSPIPTRRPRRSSATRPSPSTAALRP